MKSIGIYFGSSTEVTAGIAQTIAEKLDITHTHVHNVANTAAESVSQYEVLLLGTSTWGAGDLQDDWETFLPKLKQQDLHNKAIGLFGCGDVACYGDTFCDAIATIRDQLANTGCRFIGTISTDGYSYDESRAENNNTLMGCLIDQVNEEDKTNERIDTWIAAMKADL